MRCFICKKNPEAKDVGEIQLVLSPTLGFMVHSLVQHPRSPVKEKKIETCLTMFDADIPKLL